MPPPKDMDVLLKVEHVDAMISPQQPNIPVIVLTLEDGRNFTLYYVPYEIVLAINKINSAEEGQPIISPNQRESIFEVFLDFRDVLEPLSKQLLRVVINEIDYNTMLYTATVEFDLGGIIMRRKMIPSHAIYLALLLRKPIYVSKRLVDEQERFQRSEEDEEEEEDIKP